MELSNLEEHRQEAVKHAKNDVDEPARDAEQDVEQKRVEALKGQSKPEEPEEPDAREGAATNPGGAGF
jgi:vacuolar-type H+-ATPase subunit H